MVLGARAVYLLASVFYIIVMTALLIKRKYNLFENITFSILFLVSVIIVGNYAFPLDFNNYGINFPYKWSYIPFKELINSFGYNELDYQYFTKDIMYSYLKAFTITIPIGFCMSILIKRAIIIKVILYTVCIAYTSQIIRILFINLIAFDTGVFIFFLLGTLSGFVLKYFLRNIINNYTKKQI